VPEQFPDFDLYEELEVSPHASAEVIRAAYHRLAWLHHPDLSLGADTGRMGRLNLAYEILNDPLKRADYAGKSSVIERTPSWDEPVANSIWLKAKAYWVFGSLALRLIILFLFILVMAKFFPSTCAADISKSTFMSDRDGDYEIFVIEHGAKTFLEASGSPEGLGIPAFQKPPMTSSSHPEQLTNNDNDDWAAVLSRHGNRIAFMSNRDGDYEIFVMDADGTNLQQLTDNDDFDSSPAWSKLGDRISFMSDRNGDYEIFVMDADGTNVFGTNEMATSTNWRHQAAFRGARLYPMLDPLPQNGAQ
jgi:curved DNA-binding protein CbpA